MSYQETHGYKSAFNFSGTSVSFLKNNICEETTTHRTSKNTWVLKSKLYQQSSHVAL